MLELRNISKRFEGVKSCPDFNLTTTIEKSWPSSTFRGGKTTRFDVSRPWKNRPRGRFYNGEPLALTNSKRQPWFGSST